MGIVHSTGKLNHSYRILANSEKSFLVIAKMVFKNLYLQLSKKNQFNYYNTNSAIHLKSTKGKSIIFLVDFFHFQFLNFQYF